MNRYLLIIILSLVSFSASAQLDSLVIFRDINLMQRTSMTKWNEVLVRLSKQDSIKYGTPKSISFHDKRNLSLTPGLRYLAESLDDYESNNLEYIEAIEELVRYVRNDSVRNMSEYLKKYANTTRKREDALKKVREYWKKDSLKLAARKLFRSTANKDSIEQRRFESEDVAHLLKFIDDDKSYKWIRKISRDSTLLAIKNSAGDSLNLWVKSGRKESYRFWIKNAQNESIGAWLQTSPDKSLRILVDYDVFQQSLNEDKLEAKQPPITLIDSSLYTFGKLYPYKRIPTKWSYASIVNVGLTQGHVANWQEGGESSIAGLIDIKAFCDYKHKKSTWENTINYRYGLMQSGDEQTKKTEDLMEYNSKFGLKFYRNWYFSTMFNFKSQITNGYNYLEDDKKEIVSRFMSPGYFLFSIGLDYKPSKNLSVLISPFTGKYTIVTDTARVDVTKYGIRAGEMVKREIGSYVKTIHKWQIDNDIKMDNELGIFKSYEGQSGEIDIDWKLSLEMKVNYFVTTKIFTHVLYDKTVSKKLQFKEILNIGVTYHF